MQAKSSPANVAAVPPSVETGEDYRTRKLREVNANAEAFRAMEAELKREHSKQWALMKDRRIVEFFDTLPDAVRAGRLLFEDGMYSAQQVDAPPIWLPYFRPVNHALRDAPHSG